MRFKKILVRGAYVLLALILLFWIAVLATQTAAFREWARGLAERQVTRLVNGEVSIGRLDGNLFTGAQLSNIRITQDGREIVTIERATARYDVRRLLQTDLALTDVTVIRPHIVLVHNDNGWRIATFLRPRSSNTASTRTFAIEALTIKDGSVVIEDGRPAGDGTRLPERFLGLDTTMRFFAGSGRVELDLARSTFRTEAPALDVRSAAGRLINGDTLQLQQFRIRTANSAIDIDGVYKGGDHPALVKTTIAASPLQIDEFATYIPGLAGRGLTPTFTAALNGPFDALDVNATVSEPRVGLIQTQVIADLLAPSRGIRGAIATERLDLGTLFNDQALTSRLTTTMDANLTFSPSMSADAVAGNVVVHSKASEFAGYRYDAVDGTVTIAGRRFTIAADATGYGASAGVAGTLTTGSGAVAYDLHGDVRHVDLRTLPMQLPIPRLESLIAGAYTARGAGSRLDGTITFETSTVEGITIEAGSQGRLGLTGEVPTYGFEGHVADLDVQRVGRALQIDAISTDQFASRLTGRLVLDAAGRDVETLRMDATANLEPSTMFDTTFNTTAIEAHIADRTLSTSVQGDVASIDLVRLTQREQLKGEVAGTFDVRATIKDLGQPVTLDTVTAEGTVRLGPSTIGPLAITEAAFDGRYADRGANVTSLTVKGPDVDATASGPLMLGDSGESQLKYHIAHSRLEDLGPLLDRDVAGKVTLDGTVAGNGAHLTSKGTAAFSPLRVDTTFEALQVDSSFDASLDDLKTETLHLAADIESTLPSLGGQPFRSLSAKVDYNSSALGFDTTLREEGRTVTGKGQLRVLEDGREIRVEQLAVTAGKATWSSSTGTPFTATFGSNGLLSLDGVELTSGMQRLTAAGTIGLKPGVEGALDVRVEQGDLMELGTMLLVQRMLGGAITATGKVTGDPEHRLFAGQLSIANGLLDGFKFQSLDADLRYDQGRVGVDATLLQTPGAQLTVKGEVATATEGPAANNPIDLMVKTDGIDLGVLQAVSPALSEASGLLVADVHVGGTSAAPRMDGTINVQKGTFTLVETGVKYTDATLDLALQGDQLRIARLHLLDDNGEPLDGSGSLSIEGRTVQNIDATIMANEFKVLDNELGELSVNTSLNVKGTLLAPQVDGLVRVHAGRLEVDALVERFTTNAYAIQPSAPATPPPDSAPTKPVGPTFDVTVEVPGNLILRGTDIRPADAAVALGNMNVTVGGSFNLRKDPGADPILRGTMTTIRGSYEFQGRRFDLLRDGTIAFRGERPIDPALALQAERLISGIVAHVNINGTMRRPSLALSSQPPLDQADILSLIVFNQPVNKLAEGQRANLGDRAVGLASGLVVSPISDTLEHALDVDLFEIESVSDEGGGPAVTIGEQVGERLFVKLRQLFGTQDASELQLEYQLTDFLRLQGSFAEGRGTANRSLTRRVESRGIDLVVFFSY